MSPFLSVLGTGPVPLAARERPAPPEGGSANMTFDYYAYGSTIGVWLVYWDNSGTLSGPLTFTANGVTGLTSLSGQQQTARGQSWREAVVDLSSYGGQSGRVVLLYYRNTNSSYNWRGDLAFDAFQFTNSSDTTTNIFPTNSSSTFKGSYGLTFSSLSNSVSDWNAGNITLNNVTTSNYSNGPWWLDTYNPPSGYTGPNNNSTKNTASNYNVICETSNSSSTNMYQNNRYCWLTTTDTFTV